MTAYVASSLDVPELSETVWNRLVEASETNTVFQTYEWTRSWLKVNRDQCQPRLCVVCDEGQVVGIAPFVLKRHPFGRHVIQFVGDGRADYCDVIAGGDNSDVLHTALSAVLALPDRWDVVELNNIPSESSTVGVIQEFCRQHGYRCLVADQYVCRALVIRGHEAEAAQVLNKPSLRRRHNYFSRRGELTCRRVTGVDVLAYLDQFFSQHVERWSTGNPPSLFHDERNREFYRELAVSMANTPWLVLSVVELDGHPIAIHYGFDYNDAIVWYKPSFDITYAKHSPGLVLLRYLIAQAVEGHRRELDFTIGDELFKRRFTNVRRKTVSIRFYRQRGRCLLERSLLAIRSAIKWRTGSGVTPTEDVHQLAAVVCAGGGVCELR